jgi:hypothetical protein
VWARNKAISAELEHLTELYRAQPSFGGLAGLMPLDRIHEIARSLDPTNVETWPTLCRERLQGESATWRAAFIQAAIAIHNGELPD